MNLYDRAPEYDDKENGASKLKFIMISEFRKTSFRKVSKDEKFMILIEQAVWMDPRNGTTPIYLPKRCIHQIFFLGR